MDGVAGGLGQDTQIPIPALPAAVTPPAAPKMLWVSWCFAGETSYHEHLPGTSRMAPRHLPFPCLCLTALVPSRERERSATTGPTSWEQKKGKLYPTKAVKFEMPDTGGDSAIS